MRAYQLPKGGAGIDALVKVERPDPKPAYRQVVVKVKACSLNFRDGPVARRLPTSTQARLEAASTACLRNMRCWRRTGS